MSATHILTVAGAIKCGARVVRGFVTQDDYQRLANTNKLRMRKRSSIKHTCAYREGGRCYTSPKKTNEARCVRRREEVSGFCRDCVRERSFVRIVQEGAAYAPH